jgi:hypothetical protein
MTTRRRSGRAHGSVSHASRLQDLTPLSMVEWGQPYTSLHDCFRF